MRLSIFICCFILWIISVDAVSFFKNFINREYILKNKFSNDAERQQNYVEKPLIKEHFEQRQRRLISQEEEIPIIHPPLLIHDVALDTNDTHHLYWQVDYTTDSVRMEVHSRAVSRHPWIAIGFSDRGELSGTDFCVFWVDWKLQSHFQNAYTNLEGRLKVFTKQECHNFRYRLSKGILKFTFTRLLRPCSFLHYEIERGTTHIMWSWGAGPLFKLDGVLAEGDLHGSLRIELLKPNLPPAMMSKVQILEINSKSVDVPAEETTYWCTVVKLPKKFKEKHHILKFGPNIQKGNEDIVHHMEVFHCEYPPHVIVPTYQGDCHADDRPREIDACRRVTAAWAMGASPFAYPEEAGLPIGGEDYNPFVMLEVHYNNPKLIAGRVDSSGISLTYSSALRKHDAAIMELGLEYTPKMAIPPDMESFMLSGYCISECTALGIPPDGIYIFGSQLHTHLTGRKVFTKHYREGKELPEMNRDNHYSTHFQEIRRLPHPVHILPGDVLITTCEHKTTNRKNITLGGFSITDEMCVNYVHYYPKIDLEVCKSSVDSKTLAQYFDFLNKLEFQPTIPSLSWGDNYKAVNWTPLRSLFLQNMYNEAPISMQCNKSTGERFPGFWDNKAVPTTIQPLTPKASCLNQPQTTDNEEIITL